MIIRDCLFVIRQAKIGKITMNSFHLKSKAEKYARQLIKQAGEIEPQITKALLNVAFLHQIEMIGLENKFKTLDSLTRKITDGAESRSFSYNTFGVKSFEKFLRQAANHNNDTLRYTFILPLEKYSIKVEQVLSDLRNVDYLIEKIWNAWRLDKTPFDRGYRGINAAVISSQKQKFELQFHTEESYRLKTDTHNFYQELRSNKTTEKRKNEIVGLMVELAKKIPIPKEVKNL